MLHRIIVIDDEASICMSLQLALSQDYAVKTATTAEAGLRMIRKEGCELCLLDMRVGADNGLDILRTIRQIDDSISVIVMTAYGTIESAVEAIKSGAYTYLTKPMDLSELLIVIEKALEFKGLQRRVEYLQNTLENMLHSNSIIGESSEMRQVFKLIGKLGSVDAGVLITGESGTGKELAARAIHTSGSRKNGPFVAINCAAIPENLLEEEFFGHQKGAFTGAVAERKGKLALADSGTLFLDEIGELPLQLQSKLLRVLQEKEYSPIGSNQIVRTNVRIIAATNSDLHAMVEEGSFRSDLYFRLCVVELRMPPLRERREDIPLLTAYFIQQNNERMNKKIRRVAPEAAQLLQQYDFPGNVRELANMIERAVIFADGNEIRAEDLPFSHMQTGAQPALEEQRAQAIDEFLSGQSLKSIESRAIAATLQKNGMHRRATAQALGISERGLRNKIEEYGLSGLQDG